MQKSAVAEPKNTSLTLLTFFGLNPVVTKTIALLIVVLPIGYFLMRLRYPCVTSESLLKAVATAKETFDRCVLTESFDAGEFDMFKRRLQRYDIQFCNSSDTHTPTHSRVSRVTARALEIATRTPSDMNKPAFVWGRLKNIVACYDDARSLIIDLKVK
ncbi:hypothetical protein L218DRAFT_454809 [Marasmius fiardii PR-910]|nr:hypothetical protein L218DRAFT_454809 [Marasmius fiardii PR-910]